jgi:hypothetical protein
MAKDINTWDEGEPFPTTSWTMIVNTRDRDPQVAREALESSGKQ